FRVPVHQAERPPRPHARADLQSGPDHGAEQRRVQLSRRALRAVAQLRVLREPTMMHRRVLLAAGLSLALAAACHEDGLFTPVVPAYPGGALFQRYVSMGHRIPRGIPSGVSDDTP